ncbi:MAG: U32 family peptidase [Planctomycetales bacterium]|nr:U32 family peptidase [Planctomycetales bacterium]
MRDGTKPELLAPAGDWDCIRAAVANGADAVYFGLETGFNARARAKNFSLDELSEITRYVHARHVKAYVTLNTLAFPSELPQLESHVRQLAQSDVDAVLVQDIGLARLIRATAPELTMHASTQMTLTSSQCIQFAEELGISRVVAPRELSVDEIRRISNESSMPLEVFVHGALCVAYSGQCLTSESLGGRSANRGQCAQACRLPYDLVCDGRDVDLGDIKYLLSPQDLAAYELIPRMLEAGVRSFKIEGRLKTPEYVANITRHYRQALDAALANRPIEFTRAEVESMEMSFSRGFSPGWLEGCDHKQLVPGLSSAKRGVLLGEVTGVWGSRIRVRLRSSIKRGDGIVFAGNRAAGEEQGGRVFNVQRGRDRLEQAVDSGEVDLTMDRNSVEPARIYVGQQVWKTDDPQLNAQWRRTFNTADPVRRVPVDMHVSAAVGQPLRIAARASNGSLARVDSDQPLEAAQRHPLTAETLRKQLGRLGGTVYELRELTAEFDGQPMAPLSVLGQLRHALVEQLEQSLPAPERTIESESVLPTLRQQANAWQQSRRNEASPINTALNEPRLHVLCRSLPQLRELLTLEVDSVLADFADIREYRQAVEAARAAATPIWLATPRIQKPDEMGIFRALERHEADGILVRNLSGLLYYGERNVPTLADFSLNAANDLTVQLLLEHHARRVTVSYDLNRDQLLELLTYAPVDELEIVIHQHMPMFHMEHCVFCAVLSPGTDKTNCGRPCDVHDVQLRDRIGMNHPLKADVGCRNTLFNAVPQSSAEIVPTLVDRGVRHFRIELLDDRGEAIHHVVELYRSLLAGRIAGKEVWRQLRASNRVGVTRGTLEERRNPLAIL